MEKTNRISVPAVDEILGHSFKVLDDGFIRVVDYMGSDESIVQAARVSYGVGTKKLSEDTGLIRYLLRHRHTTPFEMCEIKLHIRVPMDCWRQWIRHRMSSVNEYSTRYSVAIDSFQKTPENVWRSQSTQNKQGSESFLDLSTGTKLSETEQALHEQIKTVYSERLDLGVAREQARKDLPLSTYTEAYWKIDLHNLLHFLSLRMDNHAQHEIRSYATLIGNEIVKRWCPIAWEAFQDYRLSSIQFSKPEQEIIKQIILNNPANAIEIAKQYNLLKSGEEDKKGREIKELEVKLLFLGLIIPW